MSIKATAAGNVIEIDFRKRLFGKFNPEEFNASKFTITNNSQTLRPSQYDINTSKTNILITLKKNPIPGDNISFSYIDKSRNKGKSIIELRNGKDLSSFRESVQIPSRASSSLGTSNSNDSNPEKIKELPTLNTPDKTSNLITDEKHYLSFSGGGWNSHSLLSGMIAGALDAYDEDNNHALDPVLSSALSRKSPKNPPTSSSSFSPKAIAVKGGNLNNSINDKKNSLIDKTKTTVDKNNEFELSTAQLNFDRRVSRLMENIDGISANSGGGWFLSHLAYSKPFRETFEDKSLTDKFLTDGYYGNIRDMFDTPQIELNINKTGAEAVQDIEDAIDNLNPVASAIFDFLFTDLLKGAVESIYDGATTSAMKSSTVQGIVNAMNMANFYSNIAKIATVDGGLSWDTIVPNTVYAPFDMYKELSGLKFNTIQGRESWAKDKDIILASALWKKPVNMQMNTEKHGWWDMLYGSRDIQSWVTTPQFEKHEWFTPLSFYSEAKKGKPNASTGALMTAGSDGQIVHHQENDGRYEWKKVETNPSELLPWNWDIISGEDDIDFYVDGGYFEKIADQWSVEKIDNNNDGWLQTPNLDLLDPFIASSSAAAGLATPSIWGSIGDRWEDRTLFWDRIKLEDLAESTSQITRELSPLATIKNGTLDMPSELPGGKTWSSDLSYDYEGGWDDAFNDLSNGGYTRLLDGGYVDNNSAATMLRHIQDKDGTKGKFNLTIFHNGSSDNIKGKVSNSHEIDGLEIKVGKKNELLASNQKKSSLAANDPITGSSKNNYSKMILPWGVAALFGKGQATFNDSYSTNDGDVVDFDTLMNPKTVSSKIFDFDAFDSKLEPDWEYNQDRVRIDYYNLDVETVNNKAFGIKGGQKGNVHLFVAVNLKSWAAPYKREFLDSYDQNFEAYRSGIAENGGYEVLKEAFGLA